MSPKEKASPLPIELFADQEAFEVWLADNYDKSQGVRLQIAKKDSGISSVSYSEALDVALCYGWIDSQKEAMDDKTWLQRFTPRGKRSLWSKVNQDKVASLIENGRMKPPGLEAIDIAKGNGQWDNAYAPQSTATLPDDFAAALEASPKAKAAYEALKKAVKYSLLFRLNNVKKQETRVKRIQDYVAKLEADGDSGLGPLI